MYMSVYIHIYVYVQICGWVGGTRAVLRTRKVAARLWIRVFDVFICLYKDMCVNVYIHADLWVGGGHACGAGDARGSCARVDDRWVRCINTLQHTATHCNTLQYTATHRNTVLGARAGAAHELKIGVFDVSTHCNTLQRTALHCNTLQHTATRCQGRARELRKS